MIDLKNLTVSYPLKQEPVLHDIELVLSKGQIGLVVGGNDCGKTTLLNTVSGIAATMYNASLSGQCQVEGKVGAVLQDSDLFLMPTVLEELEFPLYQYWHSRSKVEQIVSWLGEKLNLNHLMNRSVHTLSGGERQRVALAAALAADSDVLILDEPLAQLDSLSANNTATFLRDLADSGKTILIASTNMQYFRSISDFCYWLDQGKIQFSGSVESFIAHCPSARSKGVDLGGYELLKPEPEKAGSYPPADINNDEKVLHYSDVNYAYDSSFSLKMINLAVQPGSITAVVGENGSGKTTLLKLAAAILKPDSGTITVQGKNIGSLNIAEATADSGFLFQNPDHQIFLNQVDKEVSWGLKKRGFTETEANMMVENWLNKLALAQHASEHPYALSKTLRQWIALAGVLVREPSLLLLDEPTFGMDTVSTARFAVIAREAAEQGKSILMITHNDAVANYCADRVIKMEKGKVL